MTLGLFKISFPHLIGTVGHTVYLYQLKMVVLELLKFEMILTNVGDKSPPVFTFIVEFRKDGSRLSMNKYTNSSSSDTSVKHLTRVN